MIKKLICFFLVSLSFSQNLDSQNGLYSKLKNILEIASRNNQRILVEDFTGHDWCPFCAYGSLAISELLDEYPGTLISTQYHLSNYANEEIGLAEDCTYLGVVGTDECITPRWSGLYDGNAVPIEVFNGTTIVVGANSQIDAYNQYSSIMDTLATNLSDAASTAYEIDFYGNIQGNEVNYVVNVSMDATLEETLNQELHVVVVEDNFLTTWFGYDDPQNARNVVRNYLSIDNVSINTAGESEDWSGSFVIDTSLFNQDHIKMIAYIQNADDNRIYQVQQRNVNNFCHSAFAIHGNINGDLLEDGTGVINIFDLLTLADNIETEVPHCANTTSDFTGDGTLDEFDVIFFATMIIEGQI